MDTSSTLVVGGVSPTSQWTLPLTFHDSVALCIKVLEDSRPTGDLVSTLGTPRMSGQYFRPKDTFGRPGQDLSGPTPKSSSSCYLSKTDLPRSFRSTSFTVNCNRSSYLSLSLSPDHRRTS